MSKEELFDFLKEHLEIRLDDCSKPSSWGVYSGTIGIRATLLLKNPLTKELEEIHSDKTWLTNWD